QLRIVDLARHVIRSAGYEPDVDIPIVFTGPRPGEKLSEELVGEGEIPQASHLDGVGWVAAAPPPDWGRFDRAVSALERLAATADRVAIQGALVELLEQTAAQAGA
ncbi:MAG: polysaccharide biosynthesis protein, partial [Vicinamibacterales bacterium]